MKYPELSVNGVKVTIPDTQTVKVWISSPADVAVPEVEWDESWVVPRIADRINLGATPGYSMDITSDQLLNHPDYPYDLFTTDGDGGFRAANDGSTLGFVGTTSSIPVVAGRVYEITHHGDLIAGDRHRVAVVTSLAASVLDDTNPDMETWGYADGVFRKFYNATVTRNVALQFPNSSGGNAREFIIKNIRVREIIPQSLNDHITTTVCCWGDSHTEGIYPYRLRHLVTNAYVYNGGVGGEGTTNIKARFLAAEDKLSQPHIIWAGNNNSYQPSVVLADIAEMVAAMGHGRFRIIGLMGGSVATIGTTERTNINFINAALAATYGPKFIDIEQYIISLYNPDIPQDVVDHANGVTPTSLRSDATHLSYDGYDLVVDKLLTSFPDFFIYSTVKKPA